MFRRKVLPKALLILGLVPLSSVSQEPSEAERLFEKCAAKLKAAKTLDLEVRIVEECHLPKRNFTSRHEKDLHLTLGEGDRGRLVIRDLYAIEENLKELVSDGTGLRFSWGELSSSPIFWLDQETPKEFSSALLRGILHFEAGSGLNVRHLHDERRTPKDREWALIEEVGTPADWHLKGKEQVGQRRADVLEYTLFQKTGFGKSPQRRFTVRLWLDESTSLPLQRVKIEPGDTIVGTTTEIYKSWMLDGPLPEGVFTLPKPTAGTEKAEVPGDAEWAVQVRAVIEHLSSDDPAVRGAASSELSAFGIRVLPLLETRLGSDDLETRGQVAMVIDRIQRTDPHFLVRPPFRTTTISIKGASIPGALQEVFRPFPITPNLDLFISSRPLPPVTLALRQAGFWDAVQEFSRAAKLKFEPGEPPVFKEQLGQVDAYSVPRGSLVAVATAIRSKDDLRLNVRFYHEPGGLPISADLQIDSITDEQGTELTPLFKAAPSAFQEPIPLQHGRPLKAKLDLGPVPRMVFAGLQAVPAPAKVRDRLKLRGSGRVTLPIRVEAVEFKIQDFKGDEQKGLGECQVRMTELRVDPDKIWLMAGSKGPPSWKAPQGKLYQGGLWMVAADDVGHSAVLGGLSYGDAGSVGSGAKWPHASPATKICFIRPLEAEIMEFPVAIDGILVCPE